MFSIAKKLQLASAGLHKFCVQLVSGASPSQGIKKLPISISRTQAFSSTQQLQSLCAVLPAAAAPSATPLLTSRLLLPGLESLKAVSSCRSLHTSPACAVNSFLRMHIIGPTVKNARRKNPLGYDVCYRKGVVLKTVIKKPRKPNSANRKCVLLRLSNGKEMTAFVPGEGHTLQEHNVVLVIPKRLRDTPGVKLRCVRGQFDLGEVVKKVM